MSRPFAAWACTGLLAVAMTGCASSKEQTAAAGHATLTVYAAASLTSTFDEIGKRFQAAHPGVTVRFDYGGSSALATSIVNGAPADVFASAATANMTTVVQAGDASSPRNFASNTMEIAVPPGNPAHVSGLPDLAKPSVKVALCEATVPCGVVAAKVFANAHLDVRAVSRQADVKSTLSQVELGEVDAGVVYVTDVQAAGSKVLGIAIPPSVNATTLYPIAALTHSRDATLAREFVTYVLSPPGQAVLRAAGFASA
jgi:molybdate transport system substrate-binding protein